MLRGISENEKLNGKVFYLFGFEVTKKKQLEDAIFKFGGKISSVVDDQTTHFVTTLYEIQHMKNVIDELIGNFKIPIIKEDYIWSNTAYTEDQLFSHMEGDSNDLDTTDSQSQSKTEIPEGDLDSRWVNGRKVVSDISHEHSTYKYTPNGEFHFLLHHIYNSNDKNYKNPTDCESRNLNEKSEYDLALGFDMPLPEAKFNETFKKLCPSNYNEFFYINKERIDWQNMLSSVLNGEVIESEKNRINITINAHQHETEHYQRWLGIRARLHSRTIVEEKRQLGKDRLHINSIVNEVIGFKYNPAKGSTALEQVEELVSKVDWVESLYPTRKALLKAKPCFGGQKFERTLYAINAWVSLTRALQQQFNVLIEWTGSSTLQISCDFDEDEVGANTKTQPSFIERILKENSLQNTLEKRALTTLKEMLLRAKADVKENFGYYIQLNLAGSVVNVELLISLPLNLVLESLKFRLKYTGKLKNPSLVAVDQMLDDLRQSLSLACRTKEEYESVISYGPGWEMRQCVHSSFDAVLLQSLKFYFKLLRWKIKLVSRNTTLKEIDILDSEWGFVTGLIDAFENSRQEIVEQFCTLSSKLLERSIIKFNSQLFDISKSGQIKRFSWLFESFRLRVRKQMRFVDQLTSRFENASEYALVDSDSLEEMSDILATDHVLINTNSSESKGLYVFLSLALANDTQSIEDLLKSEFSSDPEKNAEPGYMVVISSKQDIEWEGQILDYEINLPDLEMKENRVRLISNSPSTLVKNKVQFQLLFETAGLIECQPKRANMPSIDRELSRIKHKSFKVANTILDSVEHIRRAVSNTTNVDLVENCFTFASDFGQRVMKNMDISMRAKLTLRLIRLAIDWVNFVFYDCVATDRKTFRWAVIALEFAMLLTSGENILLINEAEFETLRASVAGCMLLLISHIDIQGVRSSAESATAFNIASSKVLDPSALKSNIFYDAKSHSRNSMLEKLELLEQRRAEELYNKSLVGRILDDSRIEDRTLTFLAAYANNLSFQWQQGKFLGAGAFGTVYSATNLDSGEQMAVKELRFPDPSQLLALYKPIKEEMTVMKMLNHPHVVSYYGIEVHRDRVFIFMELCPNGSLASLLQNGRIEDENIVKIYTLQMLQGLEYLHNRNVLHRDIKPDNLLLDQYGAIKFVDFGAAKVIAISKTYANTKKGGMNKSLTGTPMYMAPEVITGGDKGNKGAQDIWSLGCCVLEMVTGKRPWSNLDNEWAIMYHAASGHPPLPEANQISPLGMSFIKECFTKSPADRPTAKALLSHPWLKDVDLSMVTPVSDISSPSSASSQNSSAPHSLRSSDGIIINSRPLIPSYHRTNSSMGSDSSGNFNSMNSQSTYNMDSSRPMSINWRNQVGISNTSLESSTLVSSPLSERSFDGLIPSSMHDF